MGGVGSRYRAFNSALSPDDVQKLDDSSKRENPGTLDELHKKTKGNSFDRKY